MKTTGIVRRIDELGRIVIPKELRKTMRIREGENLEIFTDSEQIVLKKYSLVKEISDLAQNFTDSLYTILKKNIVITDNDMVIAASGDLKNKLLKKPISDKMINSINRHEDILEKHQKHLKIIDDLDIECTYVMKPILILGDMMGMIIIFSSEQRVDENDEKMAKLGVDFFNNYLNK